MSEDYELISSPLCQEVSADGETVNVEIYRGIDDKGWVLEVVDKYGNSVVWDDRFDTDNEAFKEALKTIETEGIQSLIGSPSHSNIGFPIDKKLQEIDVILCSDTAPETAMDASTLEGFLTALIIGPELIPPSQYMPWIWDMHYGKEQMIYDSMEQMQDSMGLFMDVWNDIAETFSTDPSAFEPAYFRAAEWGAAEWCEGFLLGSRLFGESWVTLWVENPDFVKALKELGDDTGVETTQKEGDAEKWMNAVPDAVASIHAYWLEHRTANAGGFPSMPARQVSKIGRNDPCPCGSGKKYKKCCGAPPTIH